jgi:hypothetical protein
LWNFQPARPLCLVWRSDHFRIGHRWSFHTLILFSLIWYMKSLSIVFIELSMDRQAQWGHTTVYLPNFVKVCPITDILIDYTSFKYFLGSEGKLRSSVHCENPHHKQHMENFSRTFPTADREGTFVIIRLTQNTGIFKTI